MKANSQTISEDSARGHIITLDVLNDEIIKDSLFIDYLETYQKDNKLYPVKVKYYKSKLEEDEDAFLVYYILHLEEITSYRSIQEFKIRKE